MAPAATDGPIAILVAVREELAAVARPARALTSHDLSPWTVFRGELGGVSVVLARSGMGPARAGACARAVIGCFRPRLVVAAGFCGALSPDLAPGDLVVATTVLRQDAPPLAPPLTLPAGLAGARSGPFLAGQSVVSTAAEKGRLHEASPEAIALDMETGAVAAAAAACAIPWCAVRAVTDGLRDDLPFDLERFTGPDGETSRTRLAIAAMARPWRIPGLIRLGRHASLAAGNLSAFLQEAVTRL